MKTTVIGSFPYKTDIPTWFDKVQRCSTLNMASNGHSTADYNEYLKNETLQ